MTKKTNATDKARLRANLAINGGPKVRTKPWLERHMLGQEEKAAVDAMFDQAIKTGEAFGYNGAQEEAYCKEFAKYMGGGYADGVSSGTAAIYVALKALNVEPYSEVIVASITDVGGIMPIPLLNCIPMVADTAPGSYNVGPQQVEALISPRTSAIVLPHIFGEPNDIEGILKVARKHKLPVVEDCAQAHGARLNGRLLGSFGDIGAFSTMFGKHHITGGQGGLVYTRREDLYWRARRASDRGKPFGLPAGATNCFASLNFNSTDLAAAIGRVQLKKLPKIVRNRQRGAAQIVKAVAKMKAVSAPPLLPGAEPSYWYLRLRFHPEAVTCDKQTFCDALLAEGIQLRPNYDNALVFRQDWFEHRHVFGTSGLPWTSPLYRGNPNRKFPCPNALAANADHFFIWIYESWGRAEAADIVAALRKVETAYARS